MARNRQTSADTAQHGSGDHLASDGGMPGMQDWLSGTLAVPKRAVDSLLEMQRQWLKTASMGNETLALELKELQDAKDPVQFASAQISVAHQQLETCTRQVAAILQQIYDTQLLWMGQWDEKSEGAPAAQSPAQASQSALSALGRVQDEWLKVTQNWIDSINSASHTH